MVYTCKHCGKCFDGLSGLKRHKVIHSRKKPYVCSHCGKAFTDTSNCWQNKRTQHKKVTWEHAYRKKMQQTELDISQAKEGKVKQRGLSQRKNL